MGKRELLLGAAFVLIGIVVYQVTAPASDPARPRWSVGGIVESIRREVRGNQAQATAKIPSTIPVPKAVRELRIMVGSVNVTVVGEERDDIQAELDVTSNAYDAAEAERTAKATKLKVDEAGPVITVSIDFPPEGQQRASLSVKVPARLELRVEKNNALVVTNAAALSVTGRGDTTVASVPGAVHATQRGSVITLADIGPLKLTTLSGAEAKISNVNGDATLSLQGGELHGEGFTGSVEIESRNCDITLDKLEKVRQTRINAVNGEVVVRGIQTELRIDGREADIRVEQTAPAMVSIYNEGNETVELTLPLGGLKIDARTVDGRLTIDDALGKSGVKVETTGSQGGETGSSREEQHVEAVIGGGGPLITIRARRGDISLRSK
jgi:DUF4097 and DUF4098 domain-containing protein YvlB